jgi:hypothetical protein
MASLDDDLVALYVCTLTPIQLFNNSFRRHFIGRLLAQFHIVGVPTASDHQYFIFKDWDLLKEMNLWNRQ